MKAMKKNFTISAIIAIAAMLTAASCAKEENVINPSEEATLTTFTASVEEPATKTSLNSTSVFWSESDAIKVFNTDNISGVNFALSSGQGTTSGTFSGTALSGTGPFYAYYPSAKATSLADGALTVTLPPTQTYAANTFGNGANPMVATITSGDNFSFKNLCGVLKLQLIGSEIAVKSIAVSSATDILCGEGTVTFSGDNPVFTPAALNTSHTVTLDCGEAGVPLSGTATPFYIVVPVGALASGFTVAITTTGGDVMRLATTADNTIARAQIKAMPESTPSISSLVDLSETAAANCYIAQAGKKYSFDATRKATEASGSGTVDSPQSAKVIWNTGLSTNEVVSNVTFSSNTITFIATGTGNAVIAVYSGTEGSGDILWSWHIWVTDYDPATDHDTYPNSLPDANAHMMARNLGAINNTIGDVGAFGLLYQWGRKDPFIGANDIVPGAEYYSAATTAGTAWNTVASDATTGTVDYATKHPQTFIKALMDWRNTGDDDLWYTVKTKYDPCPPGWKVPHGLSDGGVWAGWPTSGLTTPEYWDGTNYGMIYPAAPPSSNWHPATGYRSGYFGAIGFVGVHVAYWSCSYRNRVDGAYYYCFGADTEETPPTVTTSPASGYSVRCLQE